MFETAGLLELINAIYGGILDNSAWEVAIGALCRAGRRRGDGRAAGHGQQPHKRRDVRRHRPVLPLDLRRADQSPGHGRPVARSGDVPGGGSPERRRRGAARAGPHSNAVPCGMAATTAHRRLCHRALAPSPSLIGGVFIPRSRRDVAYGGDEVAVLRALQPHLLRVVQARLRLKQADNAARHALDALDRVQQAVLLVDAGATVVHANRAADTALRRGDGVTARHSVLACDRADDSATLHRLVGEASAPPAAPRRHAGGQPPLRTATSVGPGGAAARRAPGSAGTPGHRNRAHRRPGLERLGIGHAAPGSSTASRRPRRVRRKRCSTTDASPTLRPS